MAYKTRKLFLDDDILMKVEKPARYTGGEINMTVKNLDEIDIRFCMCFPDVYEIGMSHLGIQILYEMFNTWDDTYCERTYSPWPDLDAIMREKNIPLFSMETQTPIHEFDFLGLTLSYEMCYSNILQVLDLSHIPLYSKDRKEGDPFIVCGGPCTYNPEPIADFMDMVYIGEGEVSFRQLLDLYKEAKKIGMSRHDFLHEASKVPGIYVPSMYEIDYNEDGTIKERRKLYDDVPDKVMKMVEGDLDHTYYPKHPIIPYIKAVQDRVVLEIQRGCIRGCRFCQAGMTYRPIRPRSLDYLKELAVEMLDSTGYDEMTLSSLSSSDYTKLPELVDFLIEECNKRKVNISLPSLRIDAFSLDVMSKIQDIKKSSLTFAPEAGSQRMRNVINKGLTVDEILKGASDAFRGGWNKVKLYYMLGLPLENYDDIREIAELANEIAAVYFERPKEERVGRPEITVSTSFFVPKPFTPFQWAPMDRADTFEEKRKHLLSCIKEQLNQRSIKYQCHDAMTSELEGLFARGDRRLAPAIEEAYKRGCIFDAWTDYFKADVWEEVLADKGISKEFYNYRTREKDEILPWDFIDIGVRRDFLWREFERGAAELVTPNCRAQCQGCGCRVYETGICVGDF